MTVKELRQELCKFDEKTEVKLVDSSHLHEISDVAHFFTLEKQQNDEIFVPFCAILVQNDIK